MVRRFLTPFLEGRGMGFFYDFLNEKHLALILTIAFFILSMSLMPANASSETIISKQDADLIFSMNKSEWEVYAQKIGYPSDWEIRRSHLATGTTVMAFHQKTGRGLSIQPLYGDDKSRPDMLIVGSYYPIGSLPKFTEALKKEIEEAAKKDLGPEYSVTVSYAKFPKFEGIELQLMQLQK
jgi:hypothetical protein